MVKEDGFAERSMIIIEALTPAFSTSPSQSVKQKPWSNVHSYLSVAEIAGALHTTKYNSA